MVDLSKATFIIPVRIDSMDRAFNFQYVVNYLCRNLKTNIKILESGPTKIAEDLLKAINPIHCKIDYWYQKDDGGAFHRTRLLNEMLVECETEVVVNYDCDILLKPETYMEAYNEILNNGVDLCYPYFVGDSQIMVSRPGLQDDLTVSAPIRHEIRNSDCGHCQFFKRTSYLAGGMESELFISYGPEDYERKNRFLKLGYNVKWLDGHFVYHIEHVRGADSSKENPHFEQNEKLYQKLITLNRQELLDYYKDAEYLKKYKKKVIVLITYADGKYEERRSKLVQRAFELGAANKSIEWDRETIEKTEFYNKNLHTFRAPIGAGYWIWKPYIILNALKKLEDNEVLVYMDSGDMITSNFSKFLNRALRQEDMLLLDGSYRHGDWTHKECFEEMWCDSKEYHDAIQLEAGVCVFRKTARTISVVSEWLGWVQNEKALYDSWASQREGFNEHRHDQSILTNLKIKYSLPSSSEMRQFITCNYH